MVSATLQPLLDQYDFATTRLLDRLAGDTVDSGDGSPIPVPEMSDEEFFWPPVPGAWTVRRRSEGLAPTATAARGTGEWIRDGGEPPYPPPITSIAWRLMHLIEMLFDRAAYSNRAGSNSRGTADLEIPDSARAGVELFRAGVKLWREAVLSADQENLNTVGYSTYQDSHDDEQPFINVIWWMNQEILHHGAEIALLRDLYRAQH